MLFLQAMRHYQRESKMRVVHRIRLNSVMIRGGTNAIRRYIAREIRAFTHGRLRCWRENQLLARMVPRFSLRIFSLILSSAVVDREAACEARANAWRRPVLLSQAERKDGTRTEAQRGGAGDNA